MENSPIPVRNQPSLLERIVVKASGPTGVLALLCAPFIVNMVCMASVRGTSLLKYTLPSAGVSSVIYLISCGVDNLYKYRSAKQIK